MIFQKSVFSTSLCLSSFFFLFVSGASATASYLPGDFNYDGCIDAADLDIVRTTWGEENYAVDLNGDGIVASFELNSLRSQWGQCYSGGLDSSPVPACLQVTTKYEEHRISSLEDENTTAVVYRDTIAWRQKRDSYKSFIVLHNINYPDREPQTISSASLKGQEYLSLSDSVVAWLEAPYNWGTYQRVVMYNRNTQETWASPYKTQSINAIAVSGKYAAWQAYPNITVRSIETGESFTVEPKDDEFFGWNLVANDYFFAYQLRTSTGDKLMLLDPQSGTSSEIVVGTSGKRTLRALGQNELLWTDIDSRTNKSSLYHYDLSTAVTTKVLDWEGVFSFHGLYGSKIMFHKRLDQGYAYNYSDVFIYDMADCSLKNITDSKYHQRAGGILGNFAVVSYSDSTRFRYSQILLYDLSKPMNNSEQLQ